MLKEYEYAAKDAGLSYKYYQHDCNRDEMIIEDVFEYYWLNEFLSNQKHSKKHPTRNEFDDLLDRELRYYLWSKCEREIIVAPFVGSRDKEKCSKKIDAYQMIKMNWHLFEPMCWEYVCKNWRKPAGK